MSATDLAPVAVCHTVAAAPPREPPAWERMTETTDFELLSSLASKAQGGDAAAYESLLEQLYGYVRRVLAARFGKFADLDDLTQECLLGMHKSLSTYHPSRNIKPWVHAIIRYKVADHFRALGRRKEFPLAENIEPVADTPDLDKPGFDGQDVRALVNALPAPLSRAVVLTKFDGLSCEEAAQREGVAASALRKRLSRAYSRLAQMFETKMEDDHGS